MAAKPTYTITLDNPFSHNGATYDSLTLRAPTVGDQLDAVKPGMSAPQAEVALLAHLADVPVDVLREVSFIDYKALQGVLLNFPYPKSARKSKKAPVTEAETQAQAPITTQD
jgi:hypothetical protein